MLSSKAALNTWSEAWGGKAKPGSMLFSHSTKMVLCFAEIIINRKGNQVLEKNYLEWKWKKFYFFLPWNPSRVLDVWSSVFSVMSFAIESDIRSSKTEFGLKALVSPMGNIS